MTPRRSSRARTTQPSPALLQHTNSSSSSNSLTRERSTRLNHKNPSPQGSSGPRSQSIEDTENGTRADLPHTRQRQRARDDDEEPPARRTRKIPTTMRRRKSPGVSEYPGLPPSRRAALGRAAVKSEAGLPPTDSSDILPDDIGSMFIQCDLCKVWQHGGCVGIMDEEMSPDEYFCEECRKDLHRIQGEPNGQRSSTYLPVAPASSPAPSSRASSRDTSRRSRDPKSRGSEGANPKRRSTMNSRDAAYDEEELIRRAIAESKEDTKSIADDTAALRTKRSRSESETQGSKRPRTTSPSPTAASKQSLPPSQPPSDDESNLPATNGTRRQRAASRGQRDKEPIKEPEEPEPEAPETGARRKDRPNRRKGDGECHPSPSARRRAHRSSHPLPPESENELGSPTKAAPPPPPPPPPPPLQTEPEPTQASPNTPTPQEPTPARPSTRKSGRPPARRGGRVGRNQYTKDRDVNGNGTESPRRGQSHDLGGDSPRVGYVGVNGTHINGGDTGRPSKPRHMHPQRTTMNEMKRRVAAILEFISRMQVEMAVASQNSSTPTGNGDRAQGLLLKSMVDQIDSAMPSTISDGGESVPALTDGDGDAPSVHDRNFSDLSSMEMMDVLTRHLLKWQQEYGKFGER
ncbi:Zinc finger PHD-type [Penicillium canariense]|uniref:Zinc finger PHD-type n=1 Tax=Penicillium canariense TaxID=189055 RepID=A0A9W9IFF1_9EURO|nr:Zinc finger PHD-type [Penicillium canariense]KAJ5176648.1 Zinc finger PHD-type [Penicillium canariense]